MDQKYKYAAWKAAQISKALRNGVAHVPGPHETPEEVAANAAAKEAEAEAAKAAAAFPSPPAEPEASARSSSETVTAPTGAGSGSGSGAGSGPTSRPSSAEAKPATTLLTPAPKPPTISFTHDTSDSPVSRVRDSGEWSTAATPGIDGNGSSEAWPGTKTGSEGARPTHIDLPGDGKDSGSRSADADADADTTNTDKTVRFRGFDGAPLSPAETFASVDQYSEIGPPPPTEVGVTPAQARPKSSPHVPKPVIPAVAPAPTPTQPSVPPQFKAAPAPKPKPSAPPAPKPASAPKPAPVSRPTPPAARPPPAPVATPSPRTAAGTRLGRRETEACQKHARWAISALDYDDYATARKELLAALAMLPPE
jgi:vacuolar protein sorting-associated protein VTA1